MFRIKIAMVVGGAVLAFFGFQEFRVSSGTSSEPLAVNLAQLEAGDVPSNPHLAIGSHYALYGGCIYEFEQSKYGSGQPSPSSKVTMCYYPIVSQEHPLIQAIADESEDFDFKNLAVVVKTKRYKTFGALPDDLIAQESSVQGLLINRIDSLDAEEKKLLRESFPSVDVDKVMILQEGRKPSSIFLSLGMMLGGMVLSLLGIGSFFIGSATS